MQSAAGQSQWELALVQEAPVQSQWELALLQSAPVQSQWELASVQCATVQSQWELASVQCAAVQSQWELSAGGPGLQVTVNTALGCPAVAYMHKQKKSISLWARNEDFHNKTSISTQSKRQTTVRDKSNDYNNIFQQGKSQYARVHSVTSVINP